MINILPWTHSYSAVSHQDVIKAIRRIPKNSVLFLETSNEYLADFGFLNKYVTEGKFPIRPASGFLKGRTRQFPSGIDPKIALELLQPQAVAYLDVLNVARKRNLSIVPFDTFVSTKRAENAFSCPDTFELFIKQLKVEFWRDVVFAKLVARHYNSNKKCFVLVGSLHAVGFSDELSKLGVKSSIKIDFLSETSREYLNQNLALDAKIYKAFLAGDYPKLRFLWEENKSFKYPKVADEAALRLSLSKRLLKDKAVREARVFRKAELRKKVRIK